MQNIEQSRAEKRLERITEAGRDRRSKAYDEIFQIFSTTNSLDATQLQPVLEKLTPKERVVFERIISLITKREGEIKEFCDRDPGEVFTSLFGFVPTEYVSLEATPQFPILIIGAVDAYKADEFGGLAALISNKKDSLPISVINRDTTTINNENPTLEQKARFLLSIFKMAEATGDMRYKNTAKIIINALSGQITWNTEVSKALESLFNRFKFKQIKINDLYDIYKINMQKFKPSDITVHEFRHALQAMIGPEMVERENRTSNILHHLWYAGYGPDVNNPTKGPYANLFTEEGFFNQPRPKLSEEEVEKFTRIFKLYFELSKEDIKYFLSKEFTAHLYDNREEEYSNIKDLIKQTLLFEIYVKRFTRFANLTNKVDYRTDDPKFSPDGKYETQEKIDSFSSEVKDIFLQEATKFCEVIIDEFLEIVKEKQEQEQGMENSQIAAYIDLMFLDPALK